MALAFGGSTLKSAPSAWARRWHHPFRLDGSTLSPRLLVIARVVAVGLLLGRVLPFGRYLPYLELLDALGSPEAFRAALWAIYALGHGLLFFSPRARLGCFCVGASLLAGLLACRPCLSVAHTFVACLFLILAASSELTGPWLVRLQVAMLYLGAFLDKAFSADWWTGRAFETLMIAREQHQAYTWLAAKLPPLSLSAAMGSLTILVQLLLLLCFLRPRWYRHGILLGTVFHGGMALLLGKMFGPFVLTVLASYLAFIDEPGWIRGGAGERGGRRWMLAGLYTTVVLLTFDAFGGLIRSAALLAVMGVVCAWYARYIPSLALTDSRNPSSSR